MSMVRTLAKVAAGALVARGVSGMMKGGGQGGAGGGLGGMLGGMLGGQGGAGGGLGGMLGGAGGAQGGGGLGGMLGGMLGGQGGAQQSGGMGGAAGAGGLGGMLGGMLSGKGQDGGGIGGLLESLGGAPASGVPSGGMAQAPAPQNGSMGSVLNSAFENFGEPEQAPSSAQEDQAKLFLRAMINAAKSDGQIDAEEKQKILGELGEVDQSEIEFVQAELAAPLDVDAFVREVPRGSEQQVYLMSLMGINLDNAAEARYLDSLAKGMGLPPEVCNAIHDKLGAPKLYT